MNIGVVIQARMSSRRLPAKVLRPLAGKPMLLYLLERLKNGCPELPIVVATSTEPLDDPLASFCAEHGFQCFRGSLANVSARFLQVIRAFAFDAVVRVCGDSPLFDPRLVRRAVELFRAQDCDLVTNTMPRTFPTGQSVEVIQSSSLARSTAYLIDQAELEHVTKVFYNHPNEFKIFNFQSGSDFRDVHLAVDEQADLERISAVIEQMTRPHWDYHLAEVVAMFRSLEVKTPSVAHAA